MKKVLVIVDPQIDFCKGGSLEVPNADEIIPFVNKISKDPKYDFVVITKDFHPNNHKSFYTSHNGKNPFDIIDLNGIKQILWPPHCVKGTRGAEFHKDLNLNIPNVYIFKKGMNPDVDSYSGFYENDHISNTGLTKFLKDKDVTDVDIVGIALDYCVMYTAIDSYKDGFNTTLILKGCRGIAPDMTNTIQELKNNGVNVV